MSKIRALDTRQQCREKLPVFFGSRDNYLHGVREVIANACDEISNNFETGQVTVTLDTDNTTITIKDSGRGMPIEEVSKFLGHEKVETTMIYCTVKDELIEMNYRKIMI